MGKEYQSGPKVIILGAGMSGILSAIKLLEEGITDFEILEMGASVGGTWRDNTYPGLSCDVPAHTYAYSFEPNWKWKGLYAEGPEIRTYFEHCADKYGVTPYVRFNTRVTRAAYENGGWTVATEDGTLRRADIVISCLGALVYPKYPDIEGLDSFTGATFHSARWDHSVPLDGKKIGVIGTGSTAVQITSALAARSGHFSLFQRTPQWVCRNFETRRPDWLRGLQRQFPILSKMTGAIQRFLFEHTFSAAVSGNKTMMKLVEYMTHSNLAKVRDPLLKKKLTPNYRIGCKRLIFSDTFYDAIQHPNAQLVTESIERIEPRGVRTKDGRLHELDVLVTATGFHALDYTRNFTVTGEQGQSLGEIWANGARAHRSVTIAGFPNYFMIIGPFSPIGNFSLTGISEIQLRYIMTFVRMIKRREVKRVGTKLSAQDRYNDVLQDGLKGTVWTSGCASWYLDANGVPRMYPFTPDRFRQDMKQADLAEFELLGD